MSSDNEAKRSSVKKEKKQANDWALGNSSSFGNSCGFFFVTFYQLEEQLGDDGTIQPGVI